MNKIIILILCLFTYQIALSSECKENKGNTPCEITLDFKDTKTRRREAFMKLWQEFKTKRDSLWKIVDKNQYTKPNEAMNALNELEQMNLNNKFKLENVDHLLMDIYYMQGSISYDNKNYKDAMIAFKKLLNLPINIEPDDKTRNTIFIQAPTQIGIMYMDGLGTKINLIEAENYLTLALINYHIEPGLKRVLSKRLDKIKTELLKNLPNNPCSTQ